MKSLLTSFPSSYLPRSISDPLAGPLSSCGPGPTTTTLFQHLKQIEEKGPYTTWIPTHETAYAQPFLGRVSPEEFEGDKSPNLLPTLSFTAKLKSNVESQQSIADIDLPSTRSALPILHLPDTSAPLSDSTTDADQTKWLTTRSGASQYDVQFRTDGFSTVGQDAHQIQVRFLTEQEYKHITLPKSSTWVPWARMSVIEYKHHQNHEPGLKNIWCPHPYCWLLCAQLVQACKQQSAKDDFWFRLWHFFDQFIRMQQIETPTDYQQLMKSI